MNYILFNLGKIPDYFKETVNTILSVDKNANVYVGCNENIDLQNCNVLNINEFNSTESNYLDKNNFYRGTNYESNPLWLTSLKRIFYLNLIAENYNLKNFVHFDNDVLIYEPFEKISDCFVDKKINITRHTINQLIFGYSFFPDISLSKKLSSEIYKILVNIDEHIIANNNVPLNEMDMLGIIYKFDKNFFNPLPTLPYDNSNFIFDPASYGQYIGGTHQKPRRFYHNRIKESHHIVGAEIISKRIKPNFKNNLPTIQYDGKVKKIVNLHIHSKQLKKYLPKNYKNYTK